MQSIKQKINYVRNTWTYKNQGYVVAAALAVALIIEAGVVTLPTFKNEVVAYNTVEVLEQKCPEGNFECVLNEWAHEEALRQYEANRNYDLEQYRLEALVTGRDMLIRIMGDSEYVDYEALQAHYGY